MSRLVILTGATYGGIGFEAARQMLALNHRVVIACRDAKRGEDAVQRLQAAAPAGHVSTVQLDLCDMNSVKKGCQEIMSRYDGRLDVLVCNAGMVPSGTAPRITPDGFEESLQANHLGHFLMIKLLMPALRKSDDPRVVCVSSELHRRLGTVPASPDYLFSLSPAGNQALQQARAAAGSGAGSASASGEPAAAAGVEPPGAGASAVDAPGSSASSASGKSWMPMSVYGLTKLLNIWCATQVAAQEPRVKCNAVSPGFVPTTNLSRNAPFLGRLFMRYIMPWAPFATTLQEGARRVVAVAVGVEGASTSGAYFARGRCEQLSGAASDMGLAQQLWRASEAAVQTWTKV